MKTNTTLSRGSLPAGVPAVAAMSAPTAAITLGGLPAGPDAELLELGRKLAPLVAEINAAKGVPQDDYFWGDILDKVSALLAEILKHQPTTTEGLTVQVSALVNTHDDMFDPKTSLVLPWGLATFLQDLCRFAGVPIPTA
jgi:hypothetical protein